MVLAGGIHPHEEGVRGPAVGIGLKAPVTALGSAIEQRVAGVHREAVEGFVAEILLDATARVGGRRSDAEQPWQRIARRERQRKADLAGGPVRMDAQDVAFEINSEE